MKVKVVIERGSDGLYSCYMDNDTLSFGLNGQGASVEEAKEEFLEVYEDMRALYADEGKDFTDLEFAYEYDVDSFLNYYADILGKAGLEKITGVNQKQLWHYSAKDMNNRRKPSKATLLKIQEGLHKFANELSQVQLVD